MDFLEMKTIMEQTIPYAHDLMEMHYVPYAFGSGFCAYKVRGKNIKLVYDGKDQQIQLLASDFHERYPPENWTILVEGPFEYTWKLVLQKLSKII
jgi:hypothetical protein